MTGPLEATLRLTRAHVALADDPTVSVKSGTSGRNDQYAREGAFRSYANGVTRLILGSGNRRVQSLTMRALTPTQVATLNSMLGRTCIFRDTYGRKVYGSFLDLTAKDIPLSGRPGTNTLLTDVTLSFVSTTYTEGV